MLAVIANIVAHYNNGRKSIGLYGDMPYTIEQLGLL